MKFKLDLGALLLGCALLAGCGTPGAPRPPSLELPQPVNDLTATRQGSKVMLTWTAPRQTTDKENLRHAGPVRICRGTDTTVMVQCTAIAELPPASAPPANNGKPEQSNYVDDLPLQLQQRNVTGLASYAVEALNARGRSAGLSNQVEVPLAPTLPPPDRPSARVTAEAIEVSVAGVDPMAGNPPAGLKFEFHLYRAAEGSGSSTDLGPPWRISYYGTSYRVVFNDRSFEWQRTYVYRVGVTTLVNIAGAPRRVEGEASPEILVIANDVFPPAAPAGLQAVASGVGQPPFVDLTWAPNTEADLAGYNVYRQEEGRPPGKINTELVKTPAYRDRGAASGHKYFYSVTAVDLRGNESAHSPEAAETVP